MKSFYRSVVLVILLALVTLQVPHSADAGGMWSIYLFNQSTNELVRVYEDGTTESYTLQTGGAFVASAVAIAPNDVNLAAFCASNPTGTEQGSSATIDLYLQDLATNTIRAKIAIGASDGCMLTQKSFSPDGSLLAVGIVSAFVAPETEPAWRLLLIDVASGTIKQELSANSPELAGLQPENPNHFALALMPEVRFFGANSLIFAQIPWRTEGPGVVTALEWNFGENTVAQVEHWGQFSVDQVISTSELVWLDVDNSLPVANPGGPVPSFNVVRVQNADGTIQTVYHNAEWLPLDVQFVQNGQVLAISLLKGIDPNSTEPAPQPMKWVFVGRDGTVSEFEQPVNMYSILNPAPNGFVLLISGLEGNNQVTRLQYFNSVEMKTIWENTDSQPWMIVGGAATFDAEDLTAFPAMQ